ncbi:hypothetical protein CDAR_260481 [Caerostris darwini]|uniref:Uncharacterized protein n=1 Tax=Caerostris darwini TaxID=1538125 RepID=A0AAV4NSE4_9ARAC|nr:hypothetical protein CDAR_260481 [Caerostris darwini]
MATDVDENLFGQQSIVPIFLWILLVFVLISILGCCISVSLKWHAWKHTSSTDQLSQLQTQYQCFDFPAYGNFEAPPKYSDAVHQESSVGLNGRFNCPVIAKVENMSAFQPAYQNLLNNA